MHWFSRCLDHIDHMTEVLAHAHQLGTYGKPDRSKQYPLVTEKQIVDAVNLALTKIRVNEDTLKAKDKDIAALREQLKGYKGLTIALTAIITSALTAAMLEGGKAFILWLAYR